MKIFCQGVGEANLDIPALPRHEEIRVRALHQTRPHRHHEIDRLSRALRRSVEEGNPLDPDARRSSSSRSPRMSETSQQALSPIRTRNGPRRQSLPEVAITVHGPSLTCGTRDAFVELAMHEGCKAPRLLQGEEGLAGQGWTSRRSAEKFTPMRQDRPFIEAGENDNLIVQRIEADPDALGICGYSFLYENPDKLQSVKIAGTRAELRHDRRPQLRPVPARSSSTSRTRTARSVPAWTILAISTSRRGHGPGRLPARAWPRRAAPSCSRKCRTAPRTALRRRR